MSMSALLPGALTVGSSVPRVGRASVRTRSRRSYVTRAAAAGKDSAAKPEEAPVQPQNAAGKNLPSWQTVHFKKALVPAASDDDRAAAEGNLLPALRKEKLKEEILKQEVEAEKLLSNKQEVRSEKSAAAVKVVETPTIAKGTAPLWANVHQGKAEQNSSMWAKVNSGRTDTSAPVAVPLESPAPAATTAAAIEPAPAPLWSSVHTSKKGAKGGDKKNSESAWSRVNRAREDSDVVAPPTAAAEPPRAPKTMIVGKGPAPLWSSVHTGKTDSAWEKVNRAREESDDVIAPVAAAAEPAAAPAAINIAQGAAPLWSSVHAGKKGGKGGAKAESAWSRVNRAREDSDEVVVAPPPPAEEPTAPAALNVDKAAAPLWANVHSGAKAASAAEASAKAAMAAEKAAKASEPSSWQQVNRARGDGVGVVPIVRSEEPEAAPTQLDVGKAPAPLWANVHTSAKAAKAADAATKAAMAAEKAAKASEPSSWQQVNRARGDGVGGVPIVRSEEPEAAPTQLDVSKAPAPLWANVHTSAKTTKAAEASSWQQVNRARGDGAGAAPAARTEEPEAAPKPLNVEKAPAPLWASVHTTAKATKAAMAAEQAAKASEPSSWQQVNRARGTGTGVEPVVRTEEPEAAPEPLNVEKAAAPLWASVHTGKKAGKAGAKAGDGSSWQQVNRARGDGAGAAPAARTEEPEAAPTPLDVEKAAAPLWANVHTNAKVAKAAKAVAPSSWQQVNRARGDGAGAAPAARTEEPEAAPTPLDVEKAAAPLWANVHTNAKVAKAAKAVAPSSWQQVNRARGDGAGVEPAIRTEEPAAAPTPMNVAKAPPPLWSSVHTGKTDSAWQQVNRARNDWPSESPPVLTGPAEAAGESGPTPLAVDKAAAPLWSSVHTSKKGGAKAGDKSAWQQVNRARRDGAGVAPVASAPVAEPTAPREMSVDAAAAPLWSSVHDKREVSAWTRVNRGRDGTSVAPQPTQPAETASVRTEWPDVPASAEQPMWALVNSGRSGTPVEPTLLNPVRTPEPVVGVAGIKAIRLFLGGKGATAVTFSVRATTRMGENVFVVGSADAMGKWDAARAVPLKYGPGGTWSATCVVPSGRVHSYKYFIRDTRSGETRWQPGINNVIAVRRGDEALEVSEDWSADPTMNKVLVAGADSSTAEGSQTRLLKMLEELTEAIDAAAVDDEKSAAAAAAAVAAAVAAATAAAQKSVAAAAKPAPPAAAQAMVAAAAVASTAATSVMSASANGGESPTVDKELLKWAAVAWTIAAAEAATQ